MKIEEELKNLSIDEIANRTAEGLVKFGQHHAFKLFSNRKFREILTFDKIPTLERDRIFNELLLSSIILTIFVLEAPDINAPEDLKNYFQNLKERIPKKLIDEFKKLGTEEKYLRDWRELIQMRYDEYKEDKLGMRNAAMEMEAKEANLTVDKLKEIQLILPAQTVALGTISHIRRGKVEENDPLNKIIFQWAGDLFLPVRLMTEGRSYNPWLRKWFHFKRWVRKILK